MQYTRLPATFTLNRLTESTQTPVHGLATMQHITPDRLGVHVRSFSGTSSWPEISLPREWEVEATIYRPLVSVRGILDHLNPEEQLITLTVHEISDHETWDLICHAVSGIWSFDLYEDHVPLLQIG